MKKLRKHDNCFAYRRFKWPSKEKQWYGFIRVCGSGSRGIKGRENQSLRNKNLWVIRRKFYFSGLFFLMRANLYGLASDLMFFTFIRCFEINLVFLLAWTRIQSIRINITALNCKIFFQYFPRAEVSYNLFPSPSPTPLLQITFYVIEIYIPLYRDQIVLDVNSEMNNSRKR